tara:strand:- start:435 stop:671 length:237 start_codon:yes stop_codon:yes gene_type:complete
MKIKNFINFRLFIVALAIGLLFVYLNETPKRVIYIYPTPSNIDKFSYKDKAGNCYKYNYNNVKCPSDSDKITEIPIQS